MRRSSLYGEIAARSGWSGDRIEDNLVGGHAEEVLADPEHAAGQEDTARPEKISSSAEGAMITGALSRLLQATRQRPSSGAAAFDT